MCRFTSSYAWVLTASGVGAMAIAAPALAATVLALELPALVEDSDHVVMATAVSEDVHRDRRGRIVTDITLHIDHHLKGPTSTGDELQVRVLGGVIGNIGMRVPGEPVIPLGSQQLLFLRDEDSVCRAVGMSQGALRITEDEDQKWVNPGASGLHLVERNGDNLVPGAAAILHPVPLADFLARVEALVAEQRGADPGATQ